MFVSAVLSCASLAERAIRAVSRYSLAVLLIVVLLLTMGCNSQEDDSVSAAPEETSQASESDSVQISFEYDASEMETYNGLPVGFTEEGYPFRGNPDAPVTIVEYSDYLCPFCGRYTSATLPHLLESYGGSGKVNFVFRDMPLTALHPTAPPGHVAAVCVGEQGAALYWEMHDQLFLSQQQWNQLPDPSQYVASLADQIGVDMDAFDECVASGRGQDVVDQGVADGQALGFNGTPSFMFVNNENNSSYPFVGAQPTAAFVNTLDTLLAGEELPDPEEEAEPEPAELPFWANEEGLAPNPDRPGYTMAGDQYKGDPDAPLVMFEFSDFQCPACRDHALLVQPELDEAFVETGQIMWVFKHLPLAMHPQSAVAAVAAECAAEQGQFWEMHHLLFKDQNQWSVDNPETELAGLAADLDLNLEQFAACLDSRQPLQRVLQDMWDGDGVVSKTPTFIAVYGGQGQVFTGSIAPESIESVLESLVEDANAGG